MKTTNSCMDGPRGLNCVFHRIFIFHPPPPPYYLIILVLFFVFITFNIFIKGNRLNSTVIKYVHTNTGLQCIFLCVQLDKSCRSINFRKISNGEKNCELLRDVHSEKPDLLLNDDQFDYYLLLDPNRVSVNRIYIYAMLHGYLCMQILFYYSGQTYRMYLRWQRCIYYTEQKKLAWLTGLRTCQCIGYTSFLLRTNFTKM